MLPPPDSKGDVDRDPALGERVVEWRCDVTSVPATLAAEDPGIWIRFVDR